MIRRAQVEEVLSDLLVGQRTLIKLLPGMGENEVSQLVDVVTPWKSPVDGLMRWCCYRLQYFKKYDKTPVFTKNTSLPTWEMLSEDYRRGVPNTEVNKCLAKIAQLGPNLNCPTSSVVRKVDPLAVFSIDQNLQPKFEIFTAENRLSEISVESQMTAVRILHFEDIWLQYFAALREPEIHFSLRSQSCENRNAEFSHFRHHCLFSFHSERLCCSSIDEFRTFFKIIVFILFFGLRMFFNVSICTVILCVVLNLS